MTPLPVQVHIHVPIWLAVGIFLVTLGRAIWVVYREQAILDQLDQATDDADRACRGLDEVKNYLFGLEPPSTGRHAHRSEAGGTPPAPPGRPEHAPRMYGHPPAPEPTGTGRLRGSE